MNHVEGDRAQGLLDGVGDIEGERVGATAGGGEGQDLAHPQGEQLTRCPIPERVGIGLEPPSALAHQCRAGGRGDEGDAVPAADELPGEPGGLGSDLALGLEGEGTDLRDRQ